MGIGFVEELVEELAAATTVASAAVKKIAVNFILRESGLVVGLGYKDCEGVGYILVEYGGSE